MSIYPTDKAIAIAADLNASDEDGWRYEAVEVKPGRARIDVYDADGVLLGPLP